MNPSSGHAPRYRFWLACAGLLAITFAGAGRSGAAPPLDDQHERLVIVAMGRATFHQFCAPCHGANARGIGPISALLPTDPLDLTKLTRKHGGRFPVEYLEEGLRALAAATTPAHQHRQMPVWGPVFLSIDGSDALAHARLAALLAFLESIQQ